jgi:hypothetical protein
VVPKSMAIIYRFFIPANNHDKIEMRSDTIRFKKTMSIKNLSSFRNVRVRGEGVFNWQGSFCLQEEVILSIK